MKYNQVKEMAKKKGLEVYKNLFKDGYTVVLPSHIGYFANDLKDLERYVKEY